MVFKLKVIYLSKFPDGDTLDIRLIDLVPLDFELLLCNINSSFGVTSATEWSLGALDDYGDMLSISSDADLPLVFQAASRQADRRVLYFWHGARQSVKNTTTGSHVLHAGVFCDVCQQVIRGVRYKCLNCADYDLCQTCCTASAHCEHLVLRITSPDHNWRQMLFDSLRPNDHWPLPLPPRASTARSAAPTTVGDNNNNNNSSSRDTVQQQQQQQQTANDAKTARAAAEPTNILSTRPRAVLNSVHAALAALGNGGGAAAAAADCSGDALGDVGRSIVSVLQSLGLAAAATAAASGVATAAADDTTPINTAHSEPDTQQQQQQQQQQPPPPVQQQQQDYQQQQPLVQQQQDYQQQQPPVQQQQQDYQQQQQQQQQQQLPEQQPQTYAELTSILKKHVSFPTPTRYARVPMSDICHDSAAPTSLSAFSQSLQAATATSSTSTSITTTTTAAPPTEGTPVNTSEIDAVHDWTMLGDTDVVASDTDSEQMLPPDLPQSTAPVPSVPIPLGWPARNIYHADPTVNAALIRLAEMGFDVANSLLVRMLEEENGDISVVLERMFNFA